MVDVSISLVGSNGDTIELTDTGNFILATGLTGFGIPSTEVRIEGSAGNGGVWRFSKRGVRELDLPLVILGANRSEVESNLRRLARLLQDSKGPTRIVANYSDGKSVYLEAHYTGGGETQFGSDAGMTYCRWVITMQAPQPFWESGESESFSVSNGASGRGLLPELTKLKLTSSQALGVILVDNVGDVEAFPVWVIQGPISELSVSNGDKTFTYVAPVEEGETITIDTEAGTVVDETGANKYSNLGPAPKLFALPPGVTTVFVTGQDAGGNSQITCLYSPRYEVIH
jgi:phage-related protein